MGEATTKPGHGFPGAQRLGDDDTLDVEPAGGAAVVTSLPPAERYRLGAELGRGGMGRVVEAFDVQLGRTVALKEVLPRGEPGVARRFAREVQLTARLEHPSIVPLYDAGVTIDGRPFYVMRRVSGRPLDRLLAEADGLGGRLTLLPAVLAAIDAVAHAHRRGVIHRDLKPSNILVGELGETVVIDWGLAKRVGERDDAVAAPGPAASDSLRTQIGSVFGTPGFMAPEQARGEPIGPPGDVYALGAILYQLLAGAPPHTGTSATEVIAKTGTRAVTPVEAVTPGAPPELIAIVGKALAFEPSGRYPDAGALGEDVRRFLSGQLVAAHHYTPRQRFSRFARRHRAPLGVAALAAVTIAALAALGIRRILAERDIADTARAAAAAGQTAAERARDDARGRADQLVVMHARGLVDRDPTHAAAVLKQLPDTSDRVGEARAVAEAAIVRGAAWAIRSSDTLTTIAELSSDGRYLLQVTRDGGVQIWDLDLRMLVTARRYPPATRALWAGKAVLVTPAAAAPELFEPLTGRVVPVAAPAIRDAVATAAGDRVAFLDDEGAAHLLDVARRTELPLGPRRTAEQIELAADGSWIALADARRVTVLDASGRERTSHPGHAVRLFGSRLDRLGVAGDTQVAICTLSPRPTWTELDLSPYLPARAIDFAFRGRELDLYLSSGKVLAWNGARPWERLALRGFSPRMLEAGGELLVVPGNDGELHVSGELVTGELHLPAPLAHLRIAARAGASRIVAIGDGVIAGFDLADSFPRPLPATPDMSAVFVDDDTVLLWRPQGGPWQWYDVRTGVATAFAYEPAGLPSVIDTDPADGRVLVHELASDSSLVLLRRAMAAPRLLARGPAVWGRLLADDTVVFGLGDGRLFATTGEAPAREIAKLDGVAVVAVGLGGRRFAAASSRGELVRGDLATGAQARARLPAGSSVVLAADPHGRVLAGVDDRLLVWDSDRVVEIARLARPIVRIVARADGARADGARADGARADGGSTDAALIELADHAMVASSLVPGAPVTQVLAASARSPLVRRDGALVVGESVNSQLVVVESSPSARWDLPSYFTSRDLATMSPTGRRFVQAGFGQLALWTLPLAPAELHRWLDARTNAITDGDDVLTWSAQPTAHP